MIDLNKTGVQLSGCGYKLDSFIKGWKNNPGNKAKSNEMDIVIADPTGGESCVITINTDDYKLDTLGYVQSMRGPDGNNIMVDNYNEQQRKNNPNWKDITENDYAALMAKRMNKE